MPVKSFKKRSKGGSGDLLNGGNTTGETVSFGTTDSNAAAVVVDGSKVAEFGHRIFNQPWNLFQLPLKIQPPEDTDITTALMQLRDRFGLVLAQFDEAGSLALLNSLHSYNGPASGAVSFENGGIDLTREQPDPRPVVRVIQKSQTAIGHLIAFYNHLLDDLAFITRTGMLYVADGIQAPIADQAPAIWKLGGYDPTYFEGSTSSTWIDGALIVECNGVKYRLACSKLVE